MKLYNIKDHSEQVSFEQAVKQGLGRGQGLFFPEVIEPLADVDGLLEKPLVERSVAGDDGSSQHRQGVGWRGDGDRAAVFCHGTGARRNNFV